MTQKQVDIEYLPCPSCGKRITTFPSQKHPGNTVIHHENPECAAFVEKMVAINALPPSRIQS